MSDLVPYEGGAPPRRMEPGAPHAGRPVEPDLDTIDLREVVAVLRRNWLLVAGITLATVAVAAWVVLTQPAEYRAASVIRLEDERGAMTSGLQTAAVEQLTGKTEDPLLSQLQVLRSRRVAGPVVDSLGLRFAPVEGGPGAIPVRGLRIPDPRLADTLRLEFGEDGYVARDGDAEAAGAYGEAVTVAGIAFAVAERPEVDEAEVRIRSRDGAMDWLLDRFGAAPRENTDVVDVSFTSTDPRFAADVVNAMVAEFQAQSARTEQDQARRRRIFIEEQLAATDTQLVRAQTALTEFREQERLFSSREMLAAQQTGLLELQVRREELAVDREIYRSLLAQLTRAQEEEGRGLSTLVSTPGIAANPVIAGLYEQLVRYELALDSLTRGDWGSAPTNPDVQRLAGLAGATRGRLADAVASHVAALDARIAALDDLRRRNAAELATLPPTEAREARLMQQLETMRKVADQLREEYQRARIAEAVEIGQVEIIDRAAVPLEPIGAARGLKLVLAMVLGLMLGSGAAFVREHLNDSVRGRDDVERLLQLPSLAVVPRIAPQNGTATRPRLPIGRKGAPPRPATLVAATDPHSVGAEAYRSLRTNLIFSQAVQSFRRIVITSSSPGEGKTTTAANLGITFAQQGMRVLLVEADLRRPQIHVAFGIPREPGLSGVLTGQVSADDVIRASPVDRLDVVACGTLPFNPAELLGGEAMRAFLRDMGERYDLVILDTPPLLGASDAAVLGAEADGVILVIRAGDTDRGAAQVALTQLRRVHARVIGAVLNDPDAKLPRYGGYYQYEYYGPRV